MAQPDHYVQTDCSAVDHPKIHKLAEELRCHEIAAFGAAIALHCRTMRHCPSGDVSTVTERTLKVWLVGFPRVSWAAFVRAGLVDQEGERRVMHGWERYADKERKRDLAAKRQQKARASQRDVTPMSQRDSRVTSRQSNATEEEGEDDTEGEVKTMGAPPPVTLSQPGFSPDIVRLHAVYLEATDRKPAPITPKAAERLAELIGWAGSLEAAERGMRKIGASAWHRNNGQGKRNDNLLISKPFRADDWPVWCEDPSEARSGAPPQESRLAAMIRAQVDSMPDHMFTPSKGDRS